MVNFWWKVQKWTLGNLDAGKVSEWTILFSCQMRISTKAEGIGTRWISTSSRMGTLGISISIPPRVIFRYPLRVRLLCKQNTSLSEEYGLGMEKGRNKLLPELLAFSNRIAGTSPVVEC